MLSSLQREYFLKEQLKSIKKELGMEKDDKEALVSKYTERRDQAIEMSAEAKAMINEEVRLTRALRIHVGKGRLVDVLTHAVSWAAGEARVIGEE